MAKWHNSNVRLHSLARKWFHFHKLLAHIFMERFLVRRHTFETFYINFSTRIEVNDKNIGKMKNNQQKITDLSILVRTIYL